jgi:hypothetical protein
LSTSNPFDISATAALYSQLAGVLAGFAFAALILLLTVRLAPPIAGSTSPSAPAPTPPGQAFARSTRVLMIAFVSLVLTSVNYAILAGDAASSPRSATLELLGGLAFSTSGILLLYAIALTFDGVNAAAGSNAHNDLVEVGKYIRSVLAIVMTPLLLLLLYLGVQDFEVANGIFHISVLDVVIWVVLVLEVAGGALYYRWRSKAGTPMSDLERERSTRRTANFAFTLVLASTIGLSTASAVLNSTEERVSILVPIVILVIAVVAACSFVAHLARTQPAPVNP